MNADALAVMFSAQEVNRKGKAKRALRKRKVRFVGAMSRVDRKFGPYYEHELAEVSDEEISDDGGEYIELSYDEKVDGQFEGLSNALAEKSFVPFSKEHKDRFKRILDFQLPREKEVRKHFPCDDQYNAEVMMSGTGHVSFAAFFRPGKYCVPKKF